MGIINKILVNTRSIMKVATFGVVIGALSVTNAQVFDEED